MIHSDSVFLNTTPRRITFTLYYFYNKVLYTGIQFCVYVNDIGIKLSSSFDSLLAERQPPIEREWLAGISCVVTTHSRFVFASARC